jgi:ribosomal protein S27AE
LAALLGDVGAATAGAVRAEAGTTVASQFAGCPRCGGALQFPTDHATGRLLEQCDRCGFRQVMPRQTPAEVAVRERARFDALVAAEAADPLATDPETANRRQCARCGATLPPKRVGVRGRRYCKARARCLQASGGRRPRRIAAAIALERACAQVATELPASRAAARSVPELCPVLPWLTEAQVRRALLALVRSGRAQSAWLTERKGKTGGRPPKGYWSTRP